MQRAVLESRNLAGKAGWKADNLFGAEWPQLWAPAQVWEALEKQSVLVAGTYRRPSVSLPSTAAQSVAAGGSWVFVPTYNRYHAKSDKQMLLDWADAMPADHPYIRCIVVKSVPEEILVSVVELQIFSSQTLNIANLLDDACITYTWCSIVCMLGLFKTVHMIP